MEVAPPPWQPEREVSPQYAREQIARHFFAPTQIEVLGTGWDNIVYRVEPGGWAFRFPRRKNAIPLLETEIALLPEIARRLPVPIPNPELIARDDFGPFTGQRLIEGGFFPDDEDRHRSAPLLGEFLRALHSLPAEGAPPDLFQRANPQRMRLPEWAQREVHAPPLEKLVHGDLHVKQILFHQGKLSGVIDWGDMHRGHPALDLSVAFSFLPERSRAAFFEAYGPVDAESLKLARLRALHFCTILDRWATDLGDGRLQREARRGIERAWNEKP